MGAISAGRLDRRVKILRRLASSDDGYGTQPGDWALLAERWASVRPRMGKENPEAGGMTARAVTSFWLRFDEVTREITELDAVELDGVRYEIVVPPLQVGRREGIELLAVAGSPSAPLADGAA